MLPYSIDIVSTYSHLSLFISLYFIFHIHVPGAECSQVHVPNSMHTLPPPPPPPEFAPFPLQWRHNERDGVSNHQPHDCSFRENIKSSASLPSVQGIHRWPANSPHKGLVTRKMFQFDDVIMYIILCQFIFWTLSMMHLLPFTSWDGSMLFLFYIRLETNLIFIIFDSFAYILQGHFTGTGAIIWLPQCQSSNPEGYG